MTFCWLLVTYIVTNMLSSQAMMYYKITKNTHVQGFASILRSRNYLHMRQAQAHSSLNGLYNFLQTFPTSNKLKLCLLEGIQTDINSFQPSFL